MTSPARAAPTAMGTVLMVCPAGSKLQCMAECMLLCAYMSECMYVTFHGSSCMFNSRESKLPRLLKLNACTFQFVIVRTMLPSATFCLLSHWYDCPSLRVKSLVLLDSVLSKQEKGE